MKLVLLGGVQGVGKTTLLAWLEKKFAGRIKILDPGELFRRYFYKTRLKTLEEIEEMIVNRVLKAPEDSVLVLHWHYAVRRPSGYIPQISFSRIKRVVGSGKIERVILILLEAPIETLRKRRLADRGKKKRNLSRAAIKEEAAFEAQFFARHQALFRRALGSCKVTALRLINTDLNITKSEIRGLFKELLN